MTVNDRPGPHTVVACFVASTAISAAGAVVLGPQIASCLVIVLGAVCFAGAVVLDHIRSLTEEVER